VRWQWYAGLTLIVWGFWGLLPKLALRTLDQRSVLVWDTVGGLLVGLAVLASSGFRLGMEPRGVLGSVAYGICVIGGSFLFLLALKEGKASSVVPFTALYPLVTLVLSVLLLGERPSPVHLLGAAFAVVAVVLLSWGGD
jgi:transporter family protein